MFSVLRLLNAIVYLIEIAIFKYKQITPPHTIFGIWWSCLKINTYVNILLLHSCTKYDNIVNAI